MYISLPMDPAKLEQRLILLHLPLSHTDRFSPTCSILEGVYHVIPSGPNFQFRRYSGELLTPLCCCMVGCRKSALCLTLLIWGKQNPYCPLLTSPFPSHLSPSLGLEEKVIAFHMALLTPGEGGNNVYYSGLHHLISFCWQHWRWRFNSPLNSINTSMAECNHIGTSPTLHHLIMYCWSGEYAWTIPLIFFQIILFSKFYTSI